MAWSLAGKQCCGTAGGQEEDENKKRETAATQEKGGWGWQLRHELPIDSSDSGHFGTIIRHHPFLSFSECFNARGSIKSTSKSQSLHGAFE